MDITLILLILSGVILSVLVYVIRNLLFKVERYEDAVERQVTALEKINTVVSTSSKRLKELDTRGAFQADDETGYFFESLKEIQGLLDNSVVVDNYAAKEK